MSLRNLGAGLILSIVVGLAAVVRIMTFSEAGLKIIAQKDMQDVLYAQNQAYEYLTESQKQLESIIESHPEANSVMREFQAVHVTRWTYPDMGECPRQNNLVTVRFVQRAYDALRQCGVPLPETVVYNIRAYNDWVDAYEVVTDKYNLSGWIRTPLLFRISLINWKDPLRAEG